MTCSSLTSGKPDWNSLDAAQKYLIEHALYYDNSGWTSITQAIGVSMKDRILALLISRGARIALPAIVLITGLIITFVNVAPQDPTYTAKARLWIPSKIYITSSGEEAAPPTDSPLTTGPNALRTASEIIKSQSVTHRAYLLLKEKMGDKCPEEADITSALLAKPVENTDILELEFTSDSSEVALNGLEAGLKAFYIENNNQVDEPLQKAKARLEEQLKVAQSEYTRVKQKFKQFQDNTASIDLVTDAQTLSAEKAELEKALQENKHELYSYKSKLAYAQKQLGFGPESIVAVAKLSEDEIMKGLRQSIAETEVNLIQLKSKYQDEHPKVKRLKASLEQAKKGMQERYTALVGESEVKEALFGAAGDNAQKLLVDQMSEASSGIAAAEAKIASLNQSIAKVSSRLAAVPAQQMQEADIHRTDELATNALTSIERELQKIRLAESTTNKSSTIQTIDPPRITSSTTPKSNFTFGAGVSAACSLLVAVLQFLLLPKRITASRVVSLLPMDTVGFVPKRKEGADTKALFSAIDRMMLNLAGWFPPGPCTPVVVTSACKGDGKSTISFALASRMADSGKKVLLIDADDKAPAVHRIASISASPGLLQFLTDPSVDQITVLRRVKTNLTVIPAGGISQDEENLKHPRLTQLINELSGHFDAIIIDSYESGDDLHSLVTPAFACKWLVVVKLGHTLVKSVQNLSTQVDMLPSIECALVVTDVTQKDVKQLRQAAAVSHAPEATPVASKGDAVVFVENETATW